jgi:hypothetical protein
MSKLRQKEHKVRNLCRKLIIALSEVVDAECALQDESKTFTQQQLDEWIDLLCDAKKEVKV